MHMVLDEVGYYNRDILKQVAELLDLSEMEVSETVSFYTYFPKEGVGKYHIQVCTNVSCMLRGGYEIWNQIKDKFGIDHLGVTEDKKFSLEEVECMGSCGTAPMVAINEDFYENLSKEKVEELLTSLGGSK